MSEAHPDELEQARERIEEIDVQLVALIGERVRLAARIGELKRARGQAVLDPAREAAVVRSAAARARGAGLEPEDVRGIFWQLIGLCRRRQEA